jgi:hypothetical protein
LDLRVLRVFFDKINFLLLNSNRSGVAVAELDVEKEIDNYNLKAASQSLPTGQMKIRESS